MARQEFELAGQDRERLGRIIGSPQSAQKHVRKAGIILELGSGCGLADNMRRTGKHPCSASKGVLNKFYGSETIYTRFSTAFSTAAAPACRRPSTPPP